MLELQEIVEAWGEMPRKSRPLVDEESPDRGYSGEARGNHFIFLPQSNSPQFLVLLDSAGLTYLSSQYSFRDDVFNTFQHLCLPPST